MFIDDASTPSKPLKPRIPYTDSVSDPFLNIAPTTEWRASQFMSPEEKQLYMQSNKWHNIRSIVLSRDNYACKVCSSVDSLEIHHMSYEHLGDEQLSDLVTLCRKCHFTLHEQLGYDRETFFDFSILTNPKIPQ